MKLNVKALALAVGIVWGFPIFFTYWFLIFGYEGNALSRLGNVYLGYSVTWYGEFVGLIWGFVDGLIGGALLAWLYNKFVSILGTKVTMLNIGLIKGNSFPCPER